MKLGSREKYQPIQYCWVHIRRLLGYLVSYMPFAYRYPTNLLQCADRAAFALAALMLSCLGTATYMYNISLRQHTTYNVYIHTRVYFRGGAGGGRGGFFPPMKVFAPPQEFR